MNDGDTTRSQRSPAAMEQILAGQLHHLRAFALVASAGTIASGAQLLHKAPSAVTRSLQLLEAAVGRSLCERTPRGILPTPHGRLVLARAERISEDLRRAGSDLARAGAVPASALTEFFYNGDKLAIIVAIAETGTVSSAARQRGLGQSAASMALARIEATLGLALFHRGRHTMTPTEPAERLILHARRVFSELRHLAAELADDGEGLSGTIVLGTSPLGRTHILPMAIAAALRRHPAIRVTMIESGFDQLLEALRSGQIDAVVGVARDGAGGGEVVIEPLFSDRMAVIARADHPLAGRNLTGDDLLGARWLLPWRSSPSRKMFEQGMRALGLTPPEASVETADLAAIRQLLLASELIALVSARQMRFEFASGLAVELDTPLPVMARDVGLHTRSGAMLSPAALAVIAAIREQGCAGD